MKKTFQINADLNLNGTSVVLTVRHDDESFTLLKDDQMLGSVLNNGDNTWQLIEGDLSQEQINLIGDEIEKHYQNTDPLS